MSKKLVFFVILWIFPLFWASAQNENAGDGIKISPIKFEQVVDPGEQISQTLEVINESNSPKEMHLYVRDFKAEGETGQPKLIVPGTEEGYYLSSWIQADQSIFQFEPGERKAVNFQVAVPQNAGPGGYYGAVVIGPQAGSMEIQSEDKGAAVSTAHQAAALLLFRVKGPVDENAMIKDFKAEKSVYGAPAQVNFLTRIENLGNVHIKPYGLIEIFNMFGEKKIVTAFNDKGANILPKSVRRFENSWQASLGFGKYKASLILNYGLTPQEGGQGKKTLDSITYFWIVPWKIIIPSVIGMAALIVLIVIIIRFYRNKAIRQILEELGAGQLNYQRPASAPGRAPIGLIILFFTALVFLIGVIIFFIFFA